MPVYYCKKCGFTFKREGKVESCPDCGKLEFFQGDAFEGQGERPEGELSQITCSNCSVRYDCDYPKCPVCGAKNTIF